VAMGMYVMAVGMDFVEGLESEPYERIADFFFTETYRIRHMSKAIEEFLEMFGTTIFLIAFLKTLFSLSRECKINISERRKA
jgi:hypothetical protein